MKKIFIFLAILFLVSISSIQIIKANKKTILNSFNEYRPFLLDNGGGKECLEKLNQAGVKYTSLGDDIGNKECPIYNQVKITSFKNSSPSSKIILTCSSAIKLSNWLEETKIKSFSHMGTLNCRKRRLSGIQSEHSYGIAIDISKIDEAVIKRDWGKNTPSGLKLANAAEVACKHFSNILTPDSNKLHHDHFHLDNGLGMGCGTEKLRSFIRLLLRK